MENNELYHWGVLGMRWGVRKASSSGTSASRKSKKLPNSEDHNKVAKIRKKKISQMSNQELKEANNRLNLERNYKDLTKKKSKGKAAVKAYIRGAATLTAVVGATAVYKKYGKEVLAKIGNASA